MHAVLSSFLAVLCRRSAHQMHTKCQSQVLSYCYAPFYTYTQIHSHTSARLQLVRLTHSILSCPAHMLTNCCAVLHVLSGFKQCKCQRQSLACWHEWPYHQHSSMGWSCGWHRINRSYFSMTCCNMQALNAIGWLCGRCKVWSAANAGSERFHRQETSS